MHRGTLEPIWNQTPPPPPVKPLGAISRASRATRLHHRSPSHVHRHPGARARPRTASPPRPSWIAHVKTSNGLAGPPLPTTAARIVAPGPLPSRPARYRSRRRSATSESCERAVSRTGCLHQLTTNTSGHTIDLLGQEVPWMMHQRPWASPRRDALRTATSETGERPLRHSPWLDGGAVVG